MRKLKYSMQDRQKPFSEFQQVAAVETCDKFRYKSFLKPCLYSTWFTFIEFVFKLVVACSFWVARVINTLRKPFEFKWPEVRFNRKQTSMAPVPCIKLLTNLASSSRSGKYWPSVVFARTSLHSVRTATASGQYSQYGPCVRLVRDYYHMTRTARAQFPWKTIREKVPYEGRSRRSDRAVKHVRPY